MFLSQDNTALTTELWMQPRDISWLEALNLYARDKHMLLLEWKSQVTNKLLEWTFHQTAHSPLVKWMSGRLWMSVVEQSHLSKWLPWTDVPVTAPSSAPITQARTQPTQQPTSHLLLQQRKVLLYSPPPYNHFLHPSITLDYITFPKLARHSWWRRGGAARIELTPCL